MQKTTARTQPNSPDPLIRSLRAVRRRLLLRLWLTLSALSFLYSSCLCCVLLLITRLFPTLGNPVPAYIGLIVGGWLIATVATWSRRPFLLAAALAADRRLGLKERLTSSFELARCDGPMIQELHADARSHLGRLDPVRDFPLAPPRVLRWVWAPILAFWIAYVCLPEFDVFGFKSRQVEARVRFEKVHMQAQRLRNEAQKLMAAAPIAAGGTLAETAALLDRISGELERGEITEKQAMAQLTDLRESLKERYDNLSQSRPTPKLAQEENLGAAQDIASAIQKNQFGEAVQKARELQQRLKEGKLSEKELEAVANDLKKLAQLLGNQDAALAEALAEAAQACMNGDCDKSALAMESLALSLEDLESILKQLDELAKAGFCLGCCMGTRGAIGPWAPGETDKFGSGMGGPGKGRGGHVGPLPDVDAAFDPSLLPGPMTQGKILMSVEQRATPEPGAKPTIGYIEQTFVEARQAAEQALEQEEIPRGSRELVRQYFGTLEPQATPPPPPPTETAP